jgi:hypothetical protein
VETTQGSPARTKVTDPFEGSDEIRLCVYRVPESEQRGGKPAGDFERGEVLPATRWAAIETALADAGPARDCATPAGRFALLRRADDRYGAIYVELDGCRRILVTPFDGGAQLAQAGDTLVKRLSG